MHKREDTGPKPLLHFQKLPAGQALGNIPVAGDRGKSVALKQQLEATGLEEQGVLEQGKGKLKHGY